MPLIKSISGFRGTIGGRPDAGLTPVDIVKLTSSFVCLIRRSGIQRPRIVVGRDGRLSGTMVNQLVCGNLQAMGADVVDIGLSTTPTVEVAVTEMKADGGVILTASHNPREWNALKLLNNKGEFISKEDGEWLLEKASSDDYEFSEIDEIGSYTLENDWIERHVDKVCNLPLVNKEIIAKANLKVVVDAVNSTGGIAIPVLLRKLGVNDIIELNCDVTGNFAHNPEPLAVNLVETCARVKEAGADLGIVVDPDVDRLAFINEKGEMYGEEYTLVTVASYILQHKKGNTVSNLSSTRALRDLTQQYGAEYFAAAVGEVNVVEKMKEVDAVIGGEGNGGVIYPDLHYGRDALVGVGLFLTYLCESQCTCSELKSRFPIYYMSKNKIQLAPTTNVDQILDELAEKFKDEKVTTIDGVKIDFADGWVHLRKSNTEPIIRVYSEGKTEAEAERFAQMMLDEAKKMM
ncbi:MAG: phosphoglucosamine mutase [Lentimicrobiaceae bacterium]|nr:phosphoglucosamine mutase [Lentimicrobiaceae bacterium]